MAFLPKPEESPVGKAARAALSAKRDAAAAVDLELPLDLAASCVASPASSCASRRSTTCKGRPGRPPSLVKRLFADAKQSTVRVKAELLPAQKLALVEELREGLKVPGVSKKALLAKLSKKAGFHSAGILAATKQEERLKQAVAMRGVHGTRPAGCKLSWTKLTQSGRPNKGLRLPGTRGYLGKTDRLRAFLFFLIYCLAGLFVCLIHWLLGCLLFVSFLFVFV